MSEALEQQAAVQPRFADWKIIEAQALVVGQVSMLPDGRVLYTRWEYVDRSQVDYHHLWAMNPDGTGQINWPSVLKAAQDVGVQHFFIEDETPSPLVCIPDSLKYLRGLKL